MAEDTIPSKDHWLSIGEIANRSGVAASALRFYEDQGLISSRRTAGNQRQYQRSTLRRVAFVQAAQRVGLALAEIKSALDSLPDDRTPTSASPNSSGCATTWTAVSVADASACSAATSTTRPIGWPNAARVPAF